MEKWQTLEKLDEHVYYITNDNSNNEIIVTNFLNELIKRKYDDMEEMGLQATGIIDSDKAGFKVNERNGKADHAHTLETLLQHLDGDRKYSTEESIGTKLLYRTTIKKSWLNGTKNGIVARFVASDKKLVIYFSTVLETLTEFQANTIRNFLNYIKYIAMDKFEKIYLGFNSIVTENSDKNKIPEVIDNIETEIERMVGNKNDSRKNK